MEQSNHKFSPEAFDCEDGTHSTNTSSTLQTSPDQSNLELQLPAPSRALPTSTTAHQSIKFVRSKHGRGGYVPSTQSKLRNSLLSSVGFLELANCGDFAANVWNQVPVPLFAQVLMALGGTFAISMSYFAFKDALLSWGNVRRLREERACLRGATVEQEDSRPGRRWVEAMLAVNGREMGMEIVDRVCMDVLMWFGAVVVGVGTLMAIDGADPDLYYASNLLSGYIGNTPAALYGVLNAFWSIYVWRRARRHGIAGARELRHDTVERHLRPRVRAIQMYVVINGLTGVISGAASLITSTMWWGYVILIPCIVSSIYCNYFWRSSIGYERMFVQQQQEIVIVDKASLIEEMEYVAAVLQTLKASPSVPLSQLMDVESIASILHFLILNGLFEDFCLCVLADPVLSVALFGPAKTELIIDSRDLLTVDKQLTPRILKIMQKYVCKVGLTQFQYRERELVEILGCYLCTEEVGLAPNKHLNGA